MGICPYAQVCDSYEHDGALMVPPWQKQHSPTAKLGALVDPPEPCSSAHMRAHSLLNEVLTKSEFLSFTGLQQEGEAEGAMGDNMAVKVVLMPNAH